MTPMMIATLSRMFDVPIAYLRESHILVLATYPKYTALEVPRQEVGAGGKSVSSTEDMYRQFNATAIRLPREAEQEAIWEAVVQNLLPYDPKSSTVPYKELWRTS